MSRMSSSSVSSALPAGGVGYLATTFSYNCKYLRTPHPAWFPVPERFLAVAAEDSVDATGAATPSDFSSGGGSFDQSNLDLLPGLAGLDSGASGGLSLTFSSMDEDDDDGVPGE